MITKKGGVLDKLGKGYSPNLSTIERESAEAVGANIPHQTNRKNDGEELSVEPYLEIEDSQSGEIIYLSQPVIQRRFWYKVGNMPQFSYNLSLGVSYWHHFLPVGIIVERKKVYGNVKCSYRLIRGRSGESQEIKTWVYDDLFYMDGDLLEWNNFFVIEDSFILELRAYTGKNAGNTIIHFYFRDQEDADKFVLPEWGKGCVQEIVDYDSAFHESMLALHGFPRS